MNSVLERYKRMQERFRLPQLDELQETFKFDLDYDEEIFDQIRSEISEKIFNFTERIIEPMIGNSDSICCMFEQNMISPEEKGELFKLYKKIQVLKWENSLLMMKPNEQETVRWIRKAWDFWNNEMEIELSKLCKKLSLAWKDLKLENKNTDYHG